MQRGERARASALSKEAQKAIESMLGEGIDTPLAFEEVAAIEAILGNTQLAVAAYQRAYNAGWRYVVLTSLNPMLNSIRADPGFQALLSRMTADACEDARRV
jgi:hypothetical protein